MGVVAPGEKKKKKVQERSGVVRSTIILLLQFSVCSNKSVFYMISYFWDMLPCYSVTGHRSFEATQCPNVVEPTEF